MYTMCVCGGRGRVYNMSVLGFVYSCEGVCMCFRVYVSLGAQEYVSVRHICMLPHV